MKTLLRFIQAALLALFATAPLAQSYNDQREPVRAHQAELDQILAPIALYPDSLLSQMLIAATYPRDIAEAAAWSRANSGMQGDEAVRAVAGAPWDPSVKSLVAFPQVLAMMDERLDWTERLGDAFMQAPEQVADTIQLLRGRADQAGNLRSGGEIAVNRDYGSYVIEPATPEQVYVPYYDPRQIYGQWWWPDYQPVYWSPWPGYHWGYAGFGWGYGIAIGSGFWFSSFDWPRHYIRFHGHRPYYYHGHSRSHGHRWYSDRDHRRNIRGWDGGRGNGSRLNTRGDSRWDGRRDGGDGRRTGDGRDGRRDGRDGRDGREGRRTDGERRVDRGAPQGVTASPGQGMAPAANPVGRAAATTPTYRDSAVAGEAQRSHQPRVLPTAPGGRGYGYTGPTTSVAPSSPIERAPQRVYVPQPALQAAPVANSVSRPPVHHAPQVHAAPQVQHAPIQHESRSAPSQPVAREPRADRSERSERSERSDSSPGRESRSDSGGGRSEGRGGGRGGGRQRD